MISKNMATITRWIEERARYSTPIIRISLALVLLWFGIDELLHPDAWIGYIPPWAAPLIPVDLGTFVLFNGLLEIAIGGLLLIGWQARVAATIAALHLLSIVIAVGYSDIAVRDLGLAMMALSLVFSGAGMWSVDNRTR
ncbi:TPA: DoxX family membrane protein [Candidatus Woesearchaeota archaeon]|nr:hypothetical protein [uncultured archaeon]HIH05585.1 DoxX family membrane protein [Candidatus Woesearchaeota archaeon]